MLKPLNSILIASSFLIAGCFTSSKNSTETVTVVQEPEPVVIPTQPIYQASEKRVFDLIHTKLDVKFDWEERQLIGKAWLTLTPYFHPQSTIQIDGKSMVINDIQLCDSTGNPVKKLSHQYDDWVIDIELDKEYKKDEKLVLYIDYIAQPEKITQEGSAAINDAKGLYFINHDESKPNVPRQIWTQGETESSSCWFPTIDIPNEKMTQEISITVEEGFKTLSNGLMLYSTLNGDGTRTDVWKQELPHAPYLAMMAIGDFAVITDEWKGKEVSYFVEHEDSAYAELVFGRTKEMLDFYSEVLGYEYAWEKYNQIVVREYVSGAMENTSAVIHGSFVMRDSIEYIDANYEDVVSHELFHHWFGDLITCESWSNLPLNESFATYGEYLWREHKYGRDFADVGIHDNLEDYLYESKRKKEDMIRFDFHDKEDMFDSHSYAKGGCILHMLRSYLGDEAFFASIKHYLHKHAFKTAEIHDLRIAFEEVCGEDLNWFFNQWFLGAGHPNLTYSYTYNEESDSIYVRVQQTQDFEIQPLYQLPIDIDIYHGKKAKRARIWIREADETVAVRAYGEPDFVNFDAEKVIVCEKSEDKTLQQWAWQYEFGPKYRDRFDALEAVVEFCNDSTPRLANEVLWMALNDKVEELRVEALGYTELIAEADSADLRLYLEKLALKDPSSSVRGSAIANLKKMRPDVGTTNTYKKALKDSSTLVRANAIGALYEVEKETALAACKEVEDSPYGNLVGVVGQVYAEDGQPSQGEFFKRRLKDLEINRAGLVYSYSQYLIKQSESTVKDDYMVIDSLSQDESANRYERIYAGYGLLEILSHYQGRLNDIDADIADQEKMATKPYDLNALKQQRERIQGVYDKVKASFKTFYEAQNKGFQNRLDRALEKSGITL